MKHIVSVSIGSAQRDHRVEMEILGENYIIERRGTDGDRKKAIELIKELDGKVDVFGMGGIDVYLNAGKNRYIIRDAVPIRDAAKKTPIVDGSGLKVSLEKKVAYYINENVENLKGKTAFILPGLDRYAMAEGLEEVGCKLILGDIMVGLGLPIPMTSLKTLDRIARVGAPIALQLPFELLYPTGKEQNKEKRKNGKFDKYFQQSDILAGDFLYIKTYMPDRMDGKIIITNTVTPEDVEWLRNAGVRILVTTTPNLQGRSFGTNVIEALLVSLINKPVDKITSEDYMNMLDKINFKPRVEYLQNETLHKSAINE